MKNVCVTWSKSPLRAVNTVKVEAKLRNCLVQQDAHVVPFLVLKINPWVPEITVLKTKTSCKVTMPRQNKTRQSKIRFTTTTETTTTTTTTTTTAIVSFVALIKIMCL